MPNPKLMQANEIVEIAKIFVANGINKIRLTGGEPLVRKDAAQIIRELGKLNVELTITSNATRVHQFIDDFENAGIRSVNISLDTLKKEKFQLITRRDQFETVKNNIHLLLERNFEVKVNVVVIKGLNDLEIPDFIEWTKNYQNQGIDWADFPHLKKWFDLIAARPAVKRGVEVLATLRKPLTGDKEREMLFGAAQYQKR